MLVNMKKMLLKAKKQKYAVGHFNFNNLEWAKAILEECEDLRAPVILGVSSRAAAYMGGYQSVVYLVKGLIVSMGITIPVAIHLDHGESFDECKRAIDAGFTSVMIDASRYSIDENIAISKLVVDYAKSRRVSVEAEVGCIGGKEDQVVAETMYAVPEECIRMVNEAGVDCLTPALGSVHGQYNGEPKLGFKEMEYLSKTLRNTPLVLHGGSGIPDFQIHMSVERGTAKINVATECQIQWAKAVREVLTNDPNVIDPRKIIGPGMLAIRKVVREKCSVFGCVGKA